MVYDAASQQFQALARDREETDTLDYFIFAVLATVACPDAGAMLKRMQLVRRFRTAAALAERCVPAKRSD